MTADGRARVAIENVRPCVDGGRFAVKRVIGEAVDVEADIFADGHDVIACVTRWRRRGERVFREAPMRHLVNDRWGASFRVEEVGFYEFTVEAWIDRFGTWRRDLGKRLDAGQDVSVELLVGAELVERAAARAVSDEGKEMARLAARLRSEGDGAERAELALSDHLAGLVWRHAERLHSVEPGFFVPVRVDRVRARCSAWYELFPRSATPEAGQHGTLRDVEARLPYVAAMGFDVLYLPPIHPIGREFRKGRNNTVKAGPEDVGSPWAIGSREGGHMAVHPALGTLEEFDRLVAAARGQGLEIAMDVAFQCAPDHPYVREHPGWFRHRPDGTIRYAENPPKKYQDIYPLDFECEDWRGLWEELKRVVLFWAAHGVQIFRVDNPHTKPLAFWEWLIAEVQREHPDAIFLSEAFTRPKVMYRLAKAGFTQSYTYFAWRNQPWEIERYFTELTRTEVAEFFRPNAWPNTPDILTEYLQHGGRGAFMARLVLAATLCASYGIYGPAFELMEHEAREPGSEEYRDSEKYQVRHWDIERADSLCGFVERVNRIRRDNPALQQDRTLRFHGVDNPRLVCYSKTSDDGENAVLCVVNTDPHSTQSGTVDLNTAALRVEGDGSYQMHDLLSGARHLWSGARNYVSLDPRACPAHVFRIRRRVRTEQQFEYFL